jgi:probable biosynthetic protein (TIGR04098 family)
MARPVPEVVVRDEFDLGLPHLGPHALGESPTLKHLGHLRWLSFERFAGVPTARVADSKGRRLYATFYFIDIAFPLSAPANAFRENDRVLVLGDLSAYGRNILDGHFAIYRAGDRRADEWGVPEPASQGRFLEAGIPYIRLSNIFIQQEQGPEKLRIGQPANADFSKIRATREAPEGHERNREAKESGRFFDPPPGSLPRSPQPVTFVHPVDPDRDVNAAGLVYFANFPAFFDVAERRALAALPAGGLPKEFADRRGTLRRRIAFFGNARTDEALRMTVECRVSPEPIQADTPPEPYGSMWFTLRCERASDGGLLAITTADRVTRLSGDADVDRWREYASTLRSESERAGQALGERAGALPEERAGAA